MTFDVNKNRGFLIAAGVALVLIIVLIVLWRGAVGSERASADELASAQEQYDAIAKRYGGEPGKELLEDYKKRLQLLSSDASLMRSAVPAEPLPELSPTQFKERLKEQLDAFRDAAAGKGNIRIPDGIGFDQFLGANMPDPREMPRLIKQFVTIKQVLGLLLDLKVEEVMLIERNIAGEQDMTLSADVDAVFSEGPAAMPGASPTKKTEAVYDAVPVRFQFRTSPAKLYRFIAGVRNLPEFYRLRSLNTSLDTQSGGEVKDPSDIVEQLTIDAVVDLVTLRAPAGQKGQETN